MPIPSLAAVRATGQVRQATALVKAAIASAAPEKAAVADAVALCQALGALEKLAGAACLRYARRVDSDPAGVLAGAQGTATGTAKRALSVAGKVSQSPVVEAALFSGDLSLDQAAVLAPAAGAVPEAAETLVAGAKAGASLRDLKLEAARTLRGARSEADQAACDQRLHDRRYCKVWSDPEGAVRLDARFGPTDGARVLACLVKETDALFKVASRAAEHEPRERLMADALVGLMTGAARASGAQVLVHVDAAALRRGEAKGAERCEVAGVGPVSVTTVRSLLGDAWATFLIRDGADITTVTSSTRVVPRRIKTALTARDGGCVVPGCAATEGLEIHHWRTGYFEHGPTELDNLSSLCRRHHAMVTKSGWRLGGGPGKWIFLPPRRQNGSRQRQEANVPGLRQRREPPGAQRVAGRGG